MIAPTARALVAGLLLTATGCSLLPYDARPRPRIENPRGDLSEMVLVGFDGVPEAGDPALWERSIQGQLLDIEGIDTIRVPLSLEDPALAEAPGRAFLGLTVLHFDPYYPPEAIVEVALDVPAAPRHASSDVLELDRLGRERMVTAGAPAAPVRFQVRVDADDARIGHDLMTFAHAQLDGDRGHDPLDRVLRNTGRFIDFISYMVIKESFRRLEAGVDTEEGTDVR